MKIKQILIIAILTGLSGCTAITESSGKALDNANSVIKTGSQNLWVPNNGAGTAGNVKQESTEQESARKKEQQPEF